MWRAATERHSKDPQTRHPYGCTSTDSGATAALIELKLSPNPGSRTGQEPVN
jgi:hypothetical protein